MAKLSAAESTSLLRLVEERALSKKELEEQKKNQRLNLIPYLPKDCISNILIRLPLESLQKSRFVCKPWCKIISSSLFIDTHLLGAETVLIFQSSTRQKASHSSSAAPLPQENPNTFSIEDKLFQKQSMNIFQPRIHPTFCIKYLEIKDGKSKMGDFHTTCLGRIRATCNGLIILDNKNKKGGLIVMNPVTRELSALPMGTLYPPHKESYGLAFCNCTREYKLVHLFQDEMQFVGCEILKLGARSWEPVDGPAFGLFSWLGYEPVSAIEGLHWVPQIIHSDCIVSMSIDEEKFVKIFLPKSASFTDRVVEMGGLLCFVTHEEMNQIDVWTLKNLCGEDWTKKYTVLYGCIRDMVPLYCSSSSGEMILKDKDGSLFAYDFEFQVMTKVEMEEGCFRSHVYLPHVNSLVSWRMQEKGQDV